MVIGWLSMNPLTIKRKMHQQLCFLFYWIQAKQRMWLIPIERNGNNFDREILLNFTSPISTLNGVGSRREKVLNDQGISTLGDLLYYFPRRHLDRTTISPIRNFTKGDVVTLMGTVESFGEKSTRRGKIFQVIVSDGTGLLTLTWFNGVRYLKPLFKIGDKLEIGRASCRERV